MCCAEGQEKPVRSAAARALGCIGESCAINYLLLALKDQEVTVRQNVADALEQIQNPDPDPRRYRYHC